MFSKKPLSIPTKGEALPGRAERMSVPAEHFVNKNRLSEPFPDGLARAVFGIMGADRTVNPHPPRRRRPKNHPARSR